MLLTLDPLSLDENSDTWLLFGTAAGVESPVLRGDEDEDSFDETSATKKLTMMTKMTSTTMKKSKTTTSKMTKTSKTMTLMMMTR